MRTTIPDEYPRVTRTTPRRYRSQRAALARRVVVGVAWLVVGILVPVDHAQAQDGSAADVPTAEESSQPSGPTVGPPCEGDCWKITDGLRRPKKVAGLYVSLAALQALDAYTTAEIVQRGGSEVNPALAPFASDTAGLIAMKVATTVGTIYFTEKIWPRHPTLAIGILAAINGVMAAVVSHNIRVKNAQGR